MKFTQLLGAFVLAAMLAACGGGGGNPGTNTSSTSGTSSTSTTSTSTTSTTGTTTTTTTTTTSISTATSSISVAVVKTASGAIVNSISNGTSYSAKALVVDAAGLPVANKVVTFSITGLPLAVLSQTTALTDASGIAVVPIAPASVTSVGATIIAASAVVSGLGISGQVDFGVTSTSTGVVSVAPSISVAVVKTVGGAVVTSISTGTSFSARAQVLDATGAPVANKAVTFSVTGLPLAVLSQTTALTDASGIALVPIAPASVVSVGASIVAASAVVSGAGVSGQVDFGVTSAGTTISAPSIRASVTNASGVDTNNINSVGTFYAKAIVLDASSNPVVGKLVSFSVGNSALATFNPVVATAITDASGIATVFIAPTSTSSSGATNMQAVATVGSTSVSGNFDFNVSPTNIAVTSPSIRVSILNGATTVTNISSSGSFVGQAVLKDGAGNPISGSVVTFSIAGAGVAVLNPVTALTNASGIAQISIAPASLSSVGATTLAANASVGGAVVSNQLDFAVSASSVSLTQLAAGSTAIASGGNTQISTVAQIGGSPASGVPVNVTFSGTCGRINGADAVAGVSVTTNGSGVASATYDSVDTSGNLCSGVVNLKAISAGATATTLAVTVALPVANAVTFVSATPAQIYVSGSGAAEQSVVVFKVLSSAGTALANQALTFSIQTNPGGVGLNASGSTASVSATTDAAGRATVSIFSGTIPGPVKVRATLVSNASVFAETQNLTVASGPPSQRFMSLAVETFNIEGWNRDGQSTNLTVRIADRQGNAVADGTVVNFVTEGGQVASSCATVKVNGISLCSVSFISQNNRPSDGRVSVLAYMAGTKDYVDVNFNNVYDAGTDTLITIGDAYVDYNENGQWDSGEFRIPRGGTTSCSSTGAPFPSVVNTCDSSLDTTVRQQAVIMFSSSAATVTSQSVSRSFVSLRIGSADHPLLPMPAGTTISASASSPTSSGCAVGKASGSPVANVNPGTNPSANLATTFAVALTGCIAGDAVFVDVTSPAGLITSFGFTLP